MTAGPLIDDRNRRRLLAALVVAAGLVALAGPVVVLTGAARGRAQSSGDPFGAGLGADGRLSAASLDVEAGQRTAPITVGALAPGDRATGSIEIVNAGDLPLHYALLMSPRGEPVESWLRWDLWLAPAAGCGGPIPGPADPGLLVAGAVLGGAHEIALFGRPETGFDIGDRVLAVGQRELLCLAVTLPLDAPDAVQGAGVAPRFVAAAEHHLTGTGGLADSGAVNGTPSDGGAGG